MEDEIDFFEELEEEKEEKEEKKEEEKIPPPAKRELLSEKAMEDDLELDEDLERLPI